MSNSTNKLLSLTPLLSMDVIRLARKCQAVHNLDVVQKDINIFLVYETDGQELAMKLRGGSSRQGGRLVSNSQLPNFLPSNFDVKMRRAPSDKPTDFVAGDERAETQASLTSIQVKDKLHLLKY